MVKKALLILAIAMLAVACNKGGTEATAGADMTPMDELKSVATNLDTKVQEIMQPINEADMVVAEINEMPAKLNIDSAKLKSMAQLTVDGTQVEVSVDLTADANVKAEVEAVFAKLKGIVDGLKATQDKVNALSQTMVETVAQLPVLATKVTTSAQAKLANPLASAEAKLEAQAELDGVVQVQADVQAKIDEIKGMSTELPAKATEALGKISASLAGGV